MNEEIEHEKLPPGCSRREFIKASALTVGASGVLFVCGQVPAQAADKSKGLPLSMAGYKFDRTNALIDGRVKVEGCDMQFKESGTEHFIRTTKMEAASMNSSLMLPCMDRFWR